MELKILTALFSILEHCASKENLWETCTLHDFYARFVKFCLTGCQHFKSKNNNSRQLPEAKEIVQATKFVRNLYFAQLLWKICVLSPQMSANSWSAEQYANRNHLIKVELRPKPVPNFYQWSNESNFSPIYPTEPMNSISKCAGFSSKTRPK